MRKIVYVGPPYGRDVVASELGAGYDVVLVEPEQGVMAGEIGDASAYLDASMKLPLDRRLLERAVNLKAVFTATTGSDHIDGEYLTQRGIPVLTLKGQNQVTNQLTPAAELSWLLVMACARRLRPAIRHVESGLWDREAFPGMMLKGRTIGIIGCGRIGMWMARYANAFDMRVLGYDPHVDEVPSYVEKTDLARLIAESDVISLHVHLSSETKGLIGTSELERVKPGVILVNTARGAVVDEAALLEALRDGRVGAYGADVLAQEPRITESALWQYARSHDNCIITPHIGGFSPDALSVVLRFTAKRIETFFAS